MKYLDEIKEKLCKELEDYGRKSKLTASDLEMVHKLTDTIKNIGKIEIQEEESGYSEARGGRGRYSRRGGEWEAMGSYDDGDSYARGRGRNAKRDSMGRYARDGYSEDYSEDSYRGGSSYERGRGRMGGYSRSDAKEHMVKKIEGMMEDADPKERKALMECLEAIEEA